MGISSRHYLFLEDGSLRRIPRRVLHGLPFGLDAIPEFADTRQRQADVVLENEAGKPVRILDVRGSFWIFDAEGKIDQGLVDGMGDWMRLVREEKTTRREGIVVDLVPELKQKEMRDKLRWTPTADEVDRIAADIWPGVHGPAPAVESVKGVVPKKPPVSYRAKDALSAIAREIGIIEERLRSLSEADLKGLIFEAHRTGSFQDESQAMWGGVAEEAERRQKIAAAKRTGRGGGRMVCRHRGDAARERAYHRLDRDRSREGLQPEGRGRQGSRATPREGGLAQRRHRSRGPPLPRAGMAAWRLTFVGHRRRGARSLKSLHQGDRRHCLTDQAAAGTKQSATSRRASSAYLANLVQRGI